MSFLKTTAIQHLNASTPTFNFTADGRVGMGTSSPSTSFHIDNQNSSYEWPDTTTVPAIYLFNRNNSSNTAHSILTLRTGGASGGNPFVSFDLYGVLGYAAGVDNVDDKFKIVPGWNSVTSSNGIHMDISGRVNMPGQPYAVGSYGGSDLAANNVLPINANITSRGGISTGSNRFTVPIAGAYVVGYSHLAAAAGGQVGIRKNGSLVAGTRSQGSGAHYCLSSSTILQLAANDYIEFQTINQPIHGNSDYNSMWIYLYG